MLFENTEVFNFEGALRGMRNPKESWNKSDSGFCSVVHCNNCRFNGTNKCEESTPELDFVIGLNDLQLAQILIRAGSEHRKFMRQIFVSVDITAPLYWWKEFDTYKVATVSNSCSTMHKLADTPITLDCFEMGDFKDVNISTVMFDKSISLNISSFYDLIMIPYMERLRQKYNETKDKRYWKELIRLLPESWLQKRTVTMNYENLLGICSKGQRRFHKLTEWSVDFIQWARNLPYAQDLLFIDELSK